MTRICDITGKKPMRANWVSHAANKNNRRQLPNLHNKSFYSEVLGRDVSLRVTTTGLRTIDKHGGLDNFMLTYKKIDTFSCDALSLRQAIVEKAAAAA